MSVYSHDFSIVYLNIRTETKKSLPLLVSATVWDKTQIVQAVFLKTVEMTQRVYITEHSL